MYRQPAHRAVLMALATIIGLGLLAAACSSSGGGGGGDGAGGGVTVPPAGAGKVVKAYSDDDVKTGGKLVYGIEAESDAMDPTKGRWAISGMLVANAIYDEMYAYDKDGVPQPYALESGVPSPDFMSWTLKLRPGMSFTNGTPVNAAALQRQVQAFHDSPLTGPALRLYKDGQVIDDLTVKVNMTAPWAAFPNVLTAQGGVLVAPETFDNPEGGLHPIGSGPFKLKEWVTGDHLSVVKNDKYWMKDSKGQQLPYLSEVVFKPIADTNARQKAFEAGDINMMHDNHPVVLAQMKQLADEGRAQYVPDTGETEETFVMINTAQPPLDDPLLRQALAYATNREDYINVTENRPELEADGVFEKKSRWYYDSHFPTNDLTKAQDLIAQYKAKHGDGPINIKLATTTSAENTKIVQMLQEQWQRIGVTVTADVVEQITIITQAVTGKFDTLLFRQFGSPDPDQEWHFWTPKNSSPIGEFGLNFSRLKDDEVDKNLDIARGSPDFATRKAAYDKVQQRWAELVPYIWLDHVQWVIVADNTVRGIGNNTLPGGIEPLPFFTGSHRLTTAWLDPSASKN